MKRRNTPAKQAVLELLKASGTALSQDIIEEKTKGQMDRVTVYRILQGFCEDGIVHKVMSDDGKQYFAMCMSCGEHHHHHNHFHFRCMGCNKVECWKDELSIKIPRGYKVAHANLVLSGLCSQCN